MVRNLKYLFTVTSTLFLILLISFSFINQPSLDTTVFAQISNNSIIDENEVNTDKINYLLNQSEVLGIIKNGTFIEVETKLPLKLTDVFMQEARSTESGFNYEPACNTMSFLFFSFNILSLHKSNSE